MADSLYLNLWFASFNEAEMMARALCVLKQFPFSESRPGVGYVGVFGVEWSEPVLFQESFDYRADPEHAISMACEFLLEQVDLDELGELRIKENIQALVDFTAAIEKHCGIRARLLWSESEENLAQKLIARLQRVQ